MMRGSTAGGAGLGALPWTRKQRPACPWLREWAGEHRCLSCAWASLGEAMSWDPPPDIPPAHPQAWSTPHLPSRKNAYGRTLRVHSGFYRAWRTADLGDRLVSRLAQLLEGCPHGARPRALFTGGRVVMGVGSMRVGWGGWRGPGHVDHSPNHTPPPGGVYTCAGPTLGLQGVMRSSARPITDISASLLPSTQPIRAQATAWAAPWRCWPPSNSCDVRRSTRRGCRCTPLAPHASATAPLPRSTGQPCPTAGA